MTGTEQITGTLSPRRKPFLSSQARAAYTLLAPTLLYILVFNIGPMFMAVYYSLTDYDAISAPEWNGIANYIRLVNDEVYLKALLNTFYYCALKIPPTLIISLAVAFILDKAIRGREVFRVSFYLPVVTSNVAIAIIWWFMYDYQWGVLNAILQGVGLQPIQWLTSATFAMPSVSVVSTWKEIGWAMVIWLAGLQGIPQTYHEVAMVDGAGPTRRFFSITLPLLAPVTVFLIVMELLKSVRVFAEVYMLTQGGPANATQVVVYRIYQEAFRFWRLGYSAAQSVVLCLIVFALSTFNLRMWREEAQV